MKTIQIDHKNGKYSVQFQELDQALADLPSDLRIVTDENVAQLYEAKLGNFQVLSISPGEQSKSMDGLGKILSWLAQSRATRKTTLCAFGGGVVGDLAGFAAAVYMRGIPLIQIPTSLLSQVDSSVGGKVGIDLPEGKNLAGAFYPPVHVSICSDSLATLPARQFINGMAEVWKYGFIMDTGLLDILSQEKLSSAHPVLSSIVERCIRLKAEVVQADEFETLGLRAILNFGHTVGHTIEFATGYGPVLHGEAISIGMVVESRIGERIGLSPNGTADQVIHCLLSQGLPVTHECLRDVDKLVQAMYADKKSEKGEIAMSLLSDIGSCRLMKGVEESVIRSALQAS